MIQQKLESERTTRTICVNCRMNVIPTAILHHLECDKHHATPEMLTVYRIATVTNLLNS